MNKKLTSLIVSFSGILFFYAISLNGLRAQEKTAFVDNWPAWRGLYNNGAVSAGNTPVEFSETKNIKWKTEIPGKGHATPIIWGNQIIVQTAVATDKKAEKASNAPASPMAPSSTDLIHQFKVISFDKATGKINWQTIVKEELPAERTHELGSWASNSPITDGEFIYAFFGSRGLFCLDMKGKVKWERNFGQMDIVASFGEGSSPAQRLRPVGEGPQEGADAYHAAVLLPHAQHQHHQHHHRPPAHHPPGGGARARVAVAIA